MDLRHANVNTTPQMTYFLGAKRVQITTDKSYDELLQHDNKMRIWTRSGKTKIMYEVGDKAQHECQ